MIKSQEKNKMCGKHVQEIAGKQVGRVLVNYCKLFKII